MQTRSKGQAGGNRRAQSGLPFHEVHLNNQRHAVKAHVEPEFYGVSLLVPVKGRAQQMQEFDCAPTREEVQAFNTLRAMEQARRALAGSADGEAVQ